MHNKDTEEFRKKFPFGYQTGYQLYWDGTGDIVASIERGRNNTSHSSVSDSVLSEMRESRYWIVGKRTKRGYVFRSWQVRVTREKEDLVGTENEDTTAFHDGNAATHLNDISTLHISL